MSGPAPSSTLQRIIGWGLLALGVAVFAVRLQHEGPYGMPRGGNLFGGVGALVLGALLARPWAGAPRALGWAALAASPVVFFFAAYAVMAELEEVVVLHATDSRGRAAPLRLWIADREDGAWVNMPLSKATEHSLDGARLELLRGGETRCVVPVLHRDRETADAIHALSGEKYAVQRFARRIGMFGDSAAEGVVSLRLDPCPAE